MGTGGEHEHNDPVAVSVVIPAYNAQATLAAQLEALAAQTFPGRFEVIVSDNGSTDSTCDIVEPFADRLAIRVVDSSDRRGAGHARNVGTAAATGELIAHCDADDIVDAAWLAALVEASADADLVGGALEHEMLNDAGSRSWRGTDGADGLPRPLDFLPFAISANCAVRRSVWERIGGWKEDYEHGGDDVDFFWRAQLDGYRLVFAPGAVVHYRHRASLTGVARQVRDFSRAEVRLFCDYRHLGISRRSLRQVGRSYLYPMTRLPYLVMSRQRRGWWVVVTAATWGRIAGSLHHRVLYL